MEEITNKPKVIKEHYEIEFLDDPEGIYATGDQNLVDEFIDDYCGICPLELDETANWLRRIPKPEAVKFIAEAWGISYRLHKYTTTEEIID